MIKEEQQNSTFTRTPKKVKLSEIFAYMKMKDCKFKEEIYHCYIRTAYYTTIKMNICKESTICDIQTNLNSNGSTNYD